MKSSIKDKIRRKNVISIPARVKKIFQKKWKYPFRLVSMLLVLGAGPALAAEIDVDGTDCTLVEAIESANNDDAMGSGCVDGSGADTINLPAGSTHTLTVVNNTSANGANGLPVISSEMVIEGNGSTIRRGDGSPDFRIIEVGSSGNLTLNKINIRNGSLITNRSDGENDGGGIHNRGTVAINNSHISDNSGSRGGGIYNFRGSLTLNSSTVSDNNGGSGAGIYSQSDSFGSPGTVTINNSTVSGNSSGNTGGGVLSGTAGVLTITNSTITNNSASFGGGLANSFNTSASISNSIVAGNTASDAGDNCRFSGPSAVINDGGNNLSNDGNTGTPATNPGFSDIIECFDPSTVASTETDFDVDCLDDLHFYGGITKTHALIPSGSGECGTNDAIDVSGLDCSSSPISNIDQRSFPRDMDCDIGAYEEQETATVNISKTTVPEGGSGFTFDVTRMGDPTLILSCFSLDDSQSQTEVIVPLDTVTVREDIPGDFELAVDCSGSQNIDQNNDFSIDNSFGTIDAVLDSGNDILDCTFTNKLLCEVSVNVTGNGQGTVSGDGINCDETNSPSCSIKSPFGSSLDLDASADSGFMFTGFTGDCDANGDITSVGSGDDINGCSDTCTAQFTDIDECTEVTDNCDENATCSNTIGGFSCECDAGYTGDGVDCTPIPQTDTNECAKGIDNCHANAVCIDTVSSFKCECEEGYSGNGVSCMPEEPGEDGEAGGGGDAEINIDNGITTNNGTRVGIYVGSDIEDGGRVLVDLPPGVFVTFAGLIPALGSCEIIDSGQTTRITVPDVICDINEFREDFELDLELCTEGELDGTADAVVEVDADNSQEEFKKAVEILLSQLNRCNYGGNSGGCTIASSNTVNDISVSNFLVTLIPAIVALGGLFRKRRKR